MTYKIAVLPGDGIGKEIVDQAARVLTALNLDITLEEAPVRGRSLRLVGASFATVNT